MTTSGRGKQKRSRREDEGKPGKKNAIIEDEVASTVGESIYIPCTFELNVALWTYDTMLRQSQHNGLRIHIGSQKIVHDTVISIRSITCMAKQKEKHIQYNGIIGFLIKLGDTWPIVALARMTTQWKKKHWFQT